MSGFFGVRDMRTAQKVAACNAPIVVKKGAGLWPNMWREAAEKSSGPSEMGMTAKAPRAAPKRVVGSQPSQPNLRCSWKIGSSRAKPIQLSKKAKTVPPKKAT